MRKPRVGVDCDGVLSDLLAVCLDVYGRMFGRQVTIDELKEWDLDSIIPKGYTEKYWEEIGKPGICRNLSPYPGAKEGMKELAEVADVYIVTSHLHTGREWVHERDEWVHHHFGIGRDRMVHTKTKLIFSGAMLIDDRPTTVEDWAWEHPHTMPVLWERPYNQRFQFQSAVNGRVMRTNSWEEVVGAVKDFGIRR